MESCSLSRPGRFTLDLGRWKKICGVVGMLDMTLFKGGVIHACHRLSVTQREAPTPLYTTCTQSWQGAKILYNTV